MMPLEYSNTTTASRLCDTSPSGMLVASLACSAPSSNRVTLRNSIFSMVGSLRKGLVTGISKPTRKGSTTSIGNDPKDPDKIPIGPGDVVSMHSRALDFIGQIRQILRRQVCLQFQASKNAAQQIVADFPAIRHGLANGLGLAQKGFGFGRFHSSTLGRFGSLRNAEI